MSSLILPPGYQREQSIVGDRLRIPEGQPGAAPAQGRVAETIPTGAAAQAALDFTDMGFISYFNLMNKRETAESSFTVPQHMYPICRALTDDRIKKLLVIIGPGSGKSYLISVSFVSFLLGCRPEFTVVGISAGEALMQGFQSAVMTWIESSNAWKACFPAVRPNRDLGWSTEAGMFVSGHRDGDPDASYIGLGISSKRLTGVHGRIILGDDLHDKENSASEDACLRVRETFYKQIMGRADPQGARYIMVGRRWHQADLYGHLEETGEYVVMKLASMRSQKEMPTKDGKKWLYWEVTIPDGVICTFNEHLYPPANTNQQPQVA